MDDDTTSAAWNQAEQEEQQQMTTEIWADFAALTKAATNPAFDLRNVFFKSTSNPDGAPYTSLPAALDHCRKLAGDHNFGFTQDVQTILAGESLLVSITSVLFHVSGERITSGPLLIRPAKQDAQGVAGSVTYGRRIGALSLFGVAGDSDDDGNEASGKQQGWAADPRGDLGKKVDTKVVNKWVKALIEQQDQPHRLADLWGEIKEDHDLAVAVWAGIPKPLKDRIKDAQEAA
jgi:hypothetical protein